MLVLFIVLISYVVPVLVIIRRGSFQAWQTYYRNYDDAADSDDWVPSYKKNELSDKKIKAILGAYVCGILWPIVLIMFPIFLAFKFIAKLWGSPSKMAREKVDKERTQANNAEVEINKVEKLLFH